MTLSLFSLLTEGPRAPREKKVLKIEVGSRKALRSKWYQAQKTDLADFSVMQGELTPLRLKWKLQ